MPFRRRFAKRTFGRRRPAYRRKRFVKRSKGGAFLTRRTKRQYGTNWKAEYGLANSAGRAVAPTQMRVKMNYWDVFPVVATEDAWSYAEYVLQLGSIYDPDGTGVGRFPRGYTAWDAIYNNYEVEGCDVHIQFYPSSDTTATNYQDAGFNLVCGAKIGNVGVATTVGDIYQAMETPKDRYFKAQYITRNGALTAQTTANNTWPAGKFKFTMNANQLRKDLGMYDANNNPIKRSDYTGEFGSNPVAPIQMVMFVGALPEEGQAQAFALPYIKAMVTLVYYVRLFNVQIATGDDVANTTLGHPGNIGPTGPQDIISFGPQGPTGSTGFQA